MSEPNDSDEVVTDPFLVSEPLVAPTTPGLAEETPVPDTIPAPAEPQPDPYVPSARRVAQE